MKADINFAQTEGFLRAPEADHAIACAIDEAVKAKGEAKEMVILINWSGYGVIDLASHDAYLSGKLNDYTMPDEDIERACLRS